MGGDGDDTRRIKSGSEYVCEINTSFLDLAPPLPFHSTLALSAFAPVLPCFRASACEARVTSE